MSTRDDRVEPGPVETKLTWGESLAYHVLYRSAHVIAPLVIGALLVLFVSRAFRAGPGSGTRSIAAVLLPLLAVTYLVNSRRGDWLAKQANRVPAGLTFGCMLGIGGVLLPVVSMWSAAPVVELLVSGSCSILLGGLVLSADREKAMAYYFGFVLGVVGAVVLRGLPTL
jgi:hypothetical protein